MEWFIGIVAVLVLMAVVQMLRRRHRALRLDRFQFPEVLSRKVRQKYPHLTEDQSHQVIEGLREYFHLCNQSGRRMVSMPSQAVDVAWHEFILFTRAYETFCRRYLGRFLHHTPAEAMTSPILAQEGIKRTWRLSCAREKIDRRSPSRLPLLFAIDSELAIADGFKYELNCSQPGSSGYCAGHIGCSSGCGGDSSCGGDSGCGGGCGGD
ncbi:glycine-rich domain-containing protein [Hahella ganghwensis]|uniref:glycine-rich domain-containing protein n=1 Tax=Hahella ganghwensis TaxID=286420 RepID=UPI00037FB2B3|nr:hypothetical protein [Hahella ganghwensis]